MVHCRQDRQPGDDATELGVGLRRAMIIGNISGRELARRLDWPHSRVVRLLMGKINVFESDVVAFLDICRPSPAERERLLRLCRAVNYPPAGDDPSTGSLP